jgi:DNA-directed RNA polymerase subunit beta
MSRIGAKNYARIPDVLALPRLIEIQLTSFNWFISEGLLDLFDEISPIESFDGMLKLYFPGRSPEAKEFNLKFWFEEPTFSQQECVERDLTFGRGLYVNVALVNKRTNEHVVNDIFLGEFPWMTENGTFIYNGTERVVVSQLIRSPGVYFDVEADPGTGRMLAQAKLIPDRGAWMEFETRKTDYITLKFNRKRTIPVTILLRALAAIEDGTTDAALHSGNDEEIIELFKDVDTNPDHPYIETTLRQEGNLQPRDKRSIAEEALLEFYRRMRPGDPPTLDNARSYLKDQLFDSRRYDLERVGRYKLNQRLGLEVPRAIRTVTKKDLIKLVQHIIRINNGLESADDIDHLGNRRVKTVGELIQSKLRIGLRRMERVVK